MRKGVFNILASLSLLLFLTLAFFAIRSYWIYDNPEFRYLPYPKLNQSPHYSLSFGSANGQIALLFMKYDEDFFANPDEKHSFRVTSNLSFFWHRSPVFSKTQSLIASGHFGFEIKHYSISTIGEGHAIALPYWLPLLLAALLPALWLKRHLRQRRRIKNNLCLACGYDLRATPSRCPECGQIPTVPK